MCRSKSRFYGQFIIAEALQKCLNSLFPLNQCCDKFESLSSLKTPLHHYDIARLTKLPYKVLPLANSVTSSMLSTLVYLYFCYFLSNEANPSSFWLSSWLLTGIIACFKACLAGVSSDRHLQYIYITSYSVDLQLLTLFYSVLLCIVLITSYSIFYCFLLYLKLTCFLLSSSSS